MPKSLTRKLESDAKLIRALLLIRASLWEWHGAQARLRDGTFAQIDSHLEVGAIDAALKVLGVEPPAPPLPQDRPRC